MVHLESLSVIQPLSSIKEAANEQNLKLPEASIASPDWANSNVQNTKTFKRQPFPPSLAM
jgi:hypothetical protein